MWGTEIWNQVFTSAWQALSSQKQLSSPIPHSPEQDKSRTNSNVLSTPSSCSFPPWLNCDEFFLLWNLCLNGIYSKCHWECFCFFVEAFWAVSNFFCHLVCWQPPKCFALQLLSQIPKKKKNPPYLCFQQVFVFLTSAPLLWGLLWLYVAKPDDARKSFHWYLSLNHICEVPFAIYSSTHSQTVVGKVQL